MSVLVTGTVRRAVNCWPVLSVTTATICASTPAEPVSAGMVRSTAATPSLSSKVATGEPTGPSGVIACTTSSPPATGSPKK